MSDNMLLTILTLPVELIYCILDNLDEKAILLSMRNVCQRFNAIIDGYTRYQVRYVGFLL